MAKTPNEYKSLPGGIPFIVISTRSKLYLGTDHVLRVNTSGWTERYRRFYFSDIQAVVVNLTNRRAVWTTVLLLLCALCLIWLLAIDDDGSRIVAGCFLAFFGVMCLVNVLRGPACVTRIQTRIGIETLPSLRRLRNARKFLALLGPYVEAAQAEPGAGAQTPTANPVEKSWEA